MENQKDQLAKRIQEANNVLITVSTNPSVDQLAAAIGLTLLLNKLKKHATAVFSGEVPSTIEFLSPDETIETNTDSLRDFIISLDKNKADKIRYKVEDTMVKIFITPYKSSINEEDLVFGQGDFNVDVVVALGVQTRDDLDQAITAHGRILHDATVTTINTDVNSEMGNINWTNPEASSLCEMVVTLSDQIKENSLDEQISTALLTGIIAETDRFSNEKTTSVTMNMSAKLMAAGANQQLVVTKLEAPEPAPETDKSDDSEDESDLPEAIIDEDGSLRIKHSSTDKPDDPPKEAPADMEMSELPEPADDSDDTSQASQAEETPTDDKPESEETNQPSDQENNAQTQRSFVDPPSRPIISEARPTGDVSRIDAPSDLKFVDKPPITGGPLSAAADRVSGEEAVLKTPHIDERPLLDHDKPSLGVNPAEPAPAEPAENDVAQSSEPANTQTPPSANQSNAELNDKTLEDIETAVNSPHQAKTSEAPQPAPINQPIAQDAPKNEPLNSENQQASSGESTETTQPQAPPVDLEAIRTQVDSAIDAAPTQLPSQPIESLGAAGRLDVPHDSQDQQQAPSEGSVESGTDETTPNIHIDTEGTISYPQNLVPENPETPKDQTAAPNSSASAPPPVPPPLMPPNLPPQ